MKLNFKLQKLVEDVKKKGQIHSIDCDEGTISRLEHLVKLGLIDKRTGSWSGEPIYSAK